MLRGTMAGQHSIRNRKLSSTKDPKTNHPADQLNLQRPSFISSQSLDGHALLFSNLDHEAVKRSGNKSVLFGARSLVATCYVWIGNESISPHTNISITWGSRRKVPPQRAREAERKIANGDVLKTCSGMEFLSPGRSLMLLCCVFFRWSFGLFTCFFSVDGLKQGFHPCWASVLLLSFAVPDDSEYLQCI